jgi:hypothetical protein
LKSEDGYELDDVMTWHGLEVHIENARGTYRRGANWETYIIFPYGYLANTIAGDGDSADVFVGDYPDAQYVYSIIQNNPETGEFDEYKHMINFPNPIQAKEAYLMGYDNRNFYGGMKVNSVEKFVREIKKYLTKKKGKQ